MRWNLLNCLLLASIIALVSANERPKRSIGYIKNLIGSKLFGTSTTTIVNARLIARNNTHQLFSIPGQNFNILIQVSNTKSYKEKKENPKIHRIVTPEIAILGTYLDIKTEVETLLAKEIAKSLMKSGVLTESILQKVMIENSEKVMQPLNIFTQERNPVYMFQPKRVNPPVPVFSVKVPPLEVAIRPVYSYTQLGHDADMKYKSFNGKDVIVTRTMKEPQPELVKTREQEFAVPSVNNKPIPYLNGRPAVVTPDETITSNNKNQNIHDTLNQNAANGQIVSKYSEKEMDHINPGQYTETKIEIPPKTNLNETETQESALPKEFVYVPPENVNIPSPVGSNSEANSVQFNSEANSEEVFTSNLEVETSTISANQFENDHIYTSNTVPFVSKEFQIVYETTQSGSFKSNPIPESTEDKAVIEESTSVNGIITEETRRGDISEPMQ